MSAIKLIPLSFALLAVPCNAQTPAAGTPTQSRASFDAAVETISTSPPYVLITAVDDRTGQSRTFCTSANFLMGAIDREYGLGSGRDDAAKAIAIAKASKDHVFHFRKQEALDNMPVRYSEAELAAAREFLAMRSTEELRAGFASLYEDRRLPTKGYARDAIACVLVERGMSPRMADISGQVYVPRSD